MAVTMFKSQFLLAIHSESNAFLRAPFNVRSFQEI